MQVLETDELGRPLGTLVFLVTSRRDEPPWRVDLGSYNRNGKCACPAFLKIESQEIPRAKAIGEFKPKDEFRCEHIRFCRKVMFERWGEQIIEQMARSSNYKPEE